MALSTDNAKQVQNPRLTEREAQLMVWMTGADFEILPQLDASEDFSDLKERLSDRYTLPQKERLDADNFHPISTGTLIVLSMNDYFARHPEAVGKMKHTMGTSHEDTKRIVFAEVDWCPRGRELFIEAPPRERARRAAYYGNLLWGANQSELELRVPEPEVYGYTHFDQEATMYRWEIDMRDKAFNADKTKISLLLPFEGLLLYCKLTDILSNDITNNADFLAPPIDQASLGNGPWRGERGIRDASEGKRAYSFYVSTVGATCKEWSSAHLVADRSEDWPVQLHARLLEDYRAVHPNPTVDYFRYEDLIVPPKLMGPLTIALRDAGRAAPIPEEISEAFAEVDGLMDNRTGAKGAPFQPDSRTVNPQDAALSALLIGAMTADLIKALERVEEPEYQSVLSKLQQKMAIRKSRSQDAQGGTTPPAPPIAPGDGNKTVNNLDP
ncbi:hypothetical protein AMS68_003659 [Peltaster fructicola]|uniref:Uncharacterized protein n=1 Tax=Peltaster fructicola TaxID=286661 RepID=A0A6H0XTP2_9PEZI|nr:hypothetical protein AMS68_003659 [Peltaster fructicola]